jgi:hypothetical protein
MDHLKQSELQTLSFVLHSSFLAAFELLPPRSRHNSPVRVSPVDIRNHPSVAEVLFLQIAGKFLPAIGTRNSPSWPQAG